MRIGAIGVAAAAIFVAGAWLAGPLAHLSTAVTSAFARELVPATGSKAAARATLAPAAAASVELSDSQIKSFKVTPVTEHLFAVEREVIGNIGFNDEMSVQVFPPNPGKITALFASAGDDVQRGAPLFAIASPDLAQAESTLISAAGTLNLTTRVLERAKQLHAAQGLPQKDVDQASADQQTAEAALKGARNNVRILGKSDADMDRIIAQRKIDTTLLVRSPIAGRITARNAAPGQLVQPGSAPAPYTISDIGTLWTLAYVAEADIPLLKLGQSVEVSVDAYPGRTFSAKIANIAAAVDSSTHRVLVRCAIRDPKHELRPGMFATFVIHTGKPARSLAVPIAGVVRQGDGSMTVWVTADRRHMVRRIVRLGMQQDGFYQVLDGLKTGELVAGDGAIFLDNALSESGQQ